MDFTWIIHASCMLLLLRFPHTWMDIPASPRMIKATTFRLPDGWTSYLLDLRHGCTQAKETVPAVDWITLEGCTIALRDGSMPEGKRTSVRLIARSLA